MLNSLLFISLAPVLIIAFYIYSRDRYEKEPVRLLIKALFIGFLCVIPAVIIENILTKFYTSAAGIKEAFYTAFAVAGFTEEAVKYLGFIFFFWNNKNFNEKFDGIVYAVYISLGFAGIENILYVFSGGYGVGLIRALTAVPAHGLFGVMMGYYFGLARFSNRFGIIYLLAAFILPFLSHGLYDFLIMGNSQYLLAAFIPVLAFYWISGFHKMSRLSEASVFKPGDIEKKADAEINEV